VDASRELMAIRTSHSGMDGSRFKQQFAIDCMDSIKHKSR
jgi:hypothetical protein